MWGGVGGAGHGLRCRIVGVKSRRCVYIDKVVFPCGIGLYERRSSRAATITHVCICVRAILFSRYQLLCNGVV